MVVTRAYAEVLVRRVPSRERSRQSGRRTARTRLRVLPVGRTVPTMCVGPGHRRGARRAKTMDDTRESNLAVADCGFVERMRPGHGLHRRGAGVRPSFLCERVFAARASERRGARGNGARSAARIVVRSDARARARRAGVQRLDDARGSWTRGVLLPTLVCARGARTWVEDRPSAGERNTLRSGALGALLAVRMDPIGAHVAGSRDVRSVTHVESGPIARKRYSWPQRFLGDGGSSGPTAPMS